MKFTFTSSVPLTGCTEQERNCMLADIVPTRFIQSKIGVVTSLNRETELILEANKNEESQSIMKTQILKALI